MFNELDGSSVHLVRLDKIVADCVVNSILNDTCTKWKCIHIVAQSQFKHNKIHGNYRLPIPSFCFLLELIRTEVRSSTLGESVSAGVWIWNPWHSGHMLLWMSGYEKR